MIKLLARQTNTLPEGLPSSSLRLCKLKYPYINIAVFIIKVSYTFVTRSKCFTVVIYEKAIHKLLQQILGIEIGEIKIS